MWSPYLAMANNPVSLSDRKGDDPEPPTVLTWHPFTTDRLRHLAYKSGVGIRTGGSKVLFNQAVGLQFEKVVGTMFNLPKNTTEYTSKGKNVIPDFVGITTVATIDKTGVSVDMKLGLFMESVDVNKFADAKAGYTVTLDGNNGQIKTMINVLAEMRSNANGKTTEQVKQGGSLYLITPFGTDIDMEVFNYGKEKGVVVASMWAYENPQKEGEIKFSHPHILGSIGHAIVDVFTKRGNELSTETGQIDFKKPNTTSTSNQ